MHEQLVELKNGDTYNGHLVNCDTWMNVNLRDVICTSKDGDRFWKMPECYIRGNTIKYIRVPNDVRAAAYCVRLHTGGQDTHSLPHSLCVCVDSDPGHGAGRRLLQAGPPVEQRTRSRRPQRRRR